MRFDRQTDPSPLSASVAVSRGQLLINWPVRFIIAAGFGVAYLLGGDKITFGSSAIAVAGFALAWLWWSYFIPQWRSWAIRQGADPEELQQLGVQSSLIWPKGSFFERTEIRRNGR